MEKHSPFHDKKSGEDLAPQTQGQVIHWPVFYELIIRVVTRGKEKAFRGFVNDLVGLQPGETVLEVGCKPEPRLYLPKNLSGKQGGYPLLNLRWRWLPMPGARQPGGGLWLTYNPG
jgi:hypothetical protein